MLFGRFSPAITAVLCSWAFCWTTGSCGADEVATAPSPDSEEKSSSFDFDYFEELMQPVPNHEEERLCGLDKVCITLWKKGKLQVYKRGRLFTGDFNLDGVQDEAIILEKDLDDDPAVNKEYLICITSKVNGVRKLLLHGTIPDAHNVIDVFWDAAKKALVIDTGGRIIRSESISSFGGTAYTYQSGQVLKVVVVVVWNPKTNGFDLLTPTSGKTKHGNK